MKSIINWWLDLTASRDWRAYRQKSGEIVMRRRVKGGWEYRPLDADEAEDDAWWQGIR